MAFGCDDDGDDGGTGGSGTGGSGTGGMGTGGTGGMTTEEMDTFIRATHLSPTVGPVDVYVLPPGGDCPTEEEELEEVLAAEGFAFNNYTDYLTLPAGEHDIAVVPAGDDCNTDIVVPVELDADTYYNAVVYTAGGDAELPAAVELVEDVDFMSDENARLTAVHVANGVGEVDIVDGDAPDTIFFEDLEIGEDITGTPSADDVSDKTLRIDAGDDGTFDCEGATIAAGDNLNLFAVFDEEDNLVIAVQPVDADAEGDEMANLSCDPVVIDE